MDIPTHCYVGILPGNRFGFICGDEPELADSIATETRWVVEKGGYVARLPLAEGKALVARLSDGGDDDAA